MYPLGLGTQDLLSLSLKDLLHLSDYETLVSELFQCQKYLIFIDQDHEVYFFRLKPVASTLYGLSEYNKHKTLLNLSSSHRTLLTPHQELSVFIHMLIPIAEGLKQYLTVSQTERKRHPYPRQADSVNKTIDRQIAEWRICRDLFYDVIVIRQTASHAQIALYQAQTQNYSTEVQVSTNLLWQRKDYYTS